MKELLLREPLKNYIEEIVDLTVTYFYPEEKNENYYSLIKEKPSEFLHQSGLVA